MSYNAAKQKIIEEVERQRQRQDDQRKYDQQEFAAMGAINNAWGNAMGIGGVGGAGGAGLLGQQVTSGMLGQYVTSATVPRYPFGELYTRNQPLPIDWRGAEYGKVEREVENGCWKLTFTSKWTHETIIVHLDLQTLSGEQVDKMAQTFLEVINQRRLG